MAALVMCVEKKCRRLSDMDDGKTRDFKDDVIYGARVSTDFGRQQVCHFNRFPGRNGGGFWTLL
jgi:hypothetical protein